MMESNREDAFHAIRVASRAIVERDFEKAKRLLNKSLRLYPTEQAKKLLASLEKDEKNDGGDDAAAGSDVPGSQQQTKQNGTSPADTRRRGGASSRGPSPARPEFNPEQLEAVKRIVKCKNYYEVLEVNKENFSESELKKKYRKLALLVHPDKNGAPGAAEAFKKVGNAYGVLSDNRKKIEYDANLNRPVEANRAGYSDYNASHFETSADITPEELFNVFFGNAFGGGSFAFDGVNRRRRTYHRQHFHHHQESHAGGSDQAQTSLLLQVLPILVLVAMSVLSSFLTQDPPFSLVQNGKYPHQRTSAKFKVPYFVQDGFARDFNRHSIARIEEQIEAEHIMNLRHSCFRERQNRDAMLWRAQHTGDRSWEKRAREIGVPSCDRLSEIHIRA